MYTNTHKSWHVLIASFVKNAAQNGFGIEKSNQKFFFNHILNGIQEIAVWKKRQHFSVKSYNIWTVSPALCHIDSEKISSDTSPFPMKWNLVHFSSWWWSGYVNSINPRYNTMCTRFCDECRWYAIINLTLNFGGHPHKIQCKSAE